jgi:hypothetical protein
MSVSTPAQVADAVLATVAALALSEAHTAVRSFWPDRKPEELLSLTLTVLPSAIERTPESRVSERRVYVMDVLVQKKIDQTGRDAEIATLTADVEEVASALYALRAGGTGFVCVGVSIDPMVSPVHMAEHGVFTAVVKARLRAVA